jgi:DNA mismatch repair protein MutS
LSAALSLRSAVGGRRSAVDGRRSAVGGQREAGREGYQLTFIQLNDPLLEQIRDEILNTDINTLTPVEALMKLNEIKKVLGEG